ncbi:MAG: cell wall metabolism sensor histidine kinase WalK [Clostridiales Family XIII bacterium]|nr:cell wall metabolism sensor histidine kinase WalK [Clostridiales Family XIII bacterium]
MRRRLFRAVLALTIVSLLVTTVTLSVVSYYTLIANIDRDIVLRAEKLAVLPEDSIRLTDHENTRVDIIAPDGAILYDSAAGAEPYDGLSDRKDIVNVLLREGTRYEIRVSSGGERRMRYAAILLASGNVLRVACVQDDIMDQFRPMLSIAFDILVVLIVIAYFVVRKIVSRIIEPLARINPESDTKAPYPELQPFVRMIDRQRERIAAQTAEQQRQNATIIAVANSIQEGVVIYDEDDNLLLLNDGLLRSFPPSAPMSINRDPAKEIMDIKEIGDYLKGRKLSEIFSDEGILSRLRGAFSVGRRAFNYVCGEQIYAVFITAIRGSGAIALFLDVTENERTAELEREFTGNVSHELKTPLTVISGYAELIEKGAAKPQDIREFAGRISTETRRLITLIEEIMLLSSLDEGKERAYSHQIELGAVLSQIAKMLAFRAAGNRVELAIDDTAAAIKGNPAMIYDMLYNIIENAIKFNKEGGRVHVSIIRKDDAVQIVISDTGAGIPARDLDRIFDRFYRVEGSRSKKTGGYGLGLSIVKSIAEAHGGSIMIESEPGEGTTVTISLPVQGPGKCDMN